MPSRPWSGYGRFCPLSRALDVIGERWTLVIVQELLKQPRRYGALLDRLPGISTSVLADRLRRLERAGVVAREPGAVGAGVVYTLTARGQELEAALRALRRWGAGLPADPTPHRSAQHSVTEEAAKEAGKACQAHRPLVGGQRRRARLWRRRGRHDDGPAVPARLGRVLRLLRPPLRRPHRQAPPPPRPAAHGSGRRQ